MSDADADADADVPIVMLGELRQVEAEVGRLKAEVGRLKAERDAFKSLCLSLSECYLPQDILGSHPWPGYERAEALMREYLGLPALPADTLTDTPASGGDGENT